MQLIGDVGRRLKVEYARFAGAEYCSLKHGGHEAVGPIRNAIDGVPISNPSGTQIRTRFRRQLGNRPEYQVFYVYGLQLSVENVFCQTDTRTYNDWLQAIKNGKQAGSNFDYGGPLTEIARLGIIATRMLGQKLEWDSENMRFTNCSEANQFINPPYREGWTL